MDNKHSHKYRPGRDTHKVRGSRILAVLISLMMVFSAAVFAETGAQDPADKTGSDAAAVSTEQGSAAVDVVTDGIEGDLAVEENDDDPDLDDDEDADDGSGEGVQPAEPTEPVAPAEFGAPVVSKAVDGNLLVLTWAAVPDADGYLAKVWAEGETEPADEAAVSVTGTSYSFELGTANTYYYKIGAVRYPEAAPETPSETPAETPADQGTTETPADQGTSDAAAEPAQPAEPAPQPAPEIAWSETGTYTAPVFSAPVISLLKLRYGTNDNGVILSWTMTNIEGVVSYDIMRGTSREFSSMTKIGTVKANKQTFDYLQDKAGTFYYAVRAVSDAGEYRVSPVSSKLTVTDKWLLKTQGLVWYGTTKSKVNLLKSAGGAKVTTLKKGTKVTAIGKSPKKVAKCHQPTWVKVRTSDGKTGWLKYSQLKGGVKATVNIKKDYTRSVKEDFVNKKGYTSKTKYLTWLCTYTQRVYTFKGSKGKWVLIHTDRATTGRFSHPTPGISQANRSAHRGQIYKRKGKVMMVTEQGRQYYFKKASYFAPGISFHTGTWWANNGKRRGSVASKPGTFGCIRMYDKGAAYIYKLPMHTSVVVTNKS